MPFAYSSFLLNLKTRLRADIAPAVIANIDDTSFKTWANEKTGEVIYLLKDSKRFELVDLITYNATLSFTAGTAGVPSQAGSAVLALRVDASNTEVKILSPEEFSKFDSSNFMSTPTKRFPVGMIAKSSIYVKPTAIDSGTNFTVGKLDYIDIHGDVTNGINFRQLGYQILIELVAQQAFTFLEEFELVKLSADKVAELVAV